MERMRISEDRYPERFFPVLLVVVTLVRSFGSYTSVEKWCCGRIIVGNLRNIHSKANGIQKVSFDAKRVLLLFFRSMKAAYRQVLLDRGSCKVQLCVPVLQRARGQYDTLIGCPGRQICCLTPIQSSKSQYSILLVYRCTIEQGYGHRCENSSMC